MTLRLTVAEDLRSVPRYAWDRLVEQCPDSTVFQCYGWINAWLHAFPDDVQRLWIFTAYDGDELVGIAPLWQGRQADEPSAETRLHFLGTGHADYQTFPARDASPEIVHALLEAIDRHAPRGMSIELSEVPQFSTLALCLAERAARQSPGIVLTGVTPCPRLRISGNDGRVDRVLRKASLRRHENKLRRLGEVTFEHLCERSAIEPLLDGFFEQHVRRWSTTAWPSLFLRPQNRVFYRTLASEMDGTGRVMFSVVRLDGRPVAQHFGLRSQDDLLWYKPTFDVNYGHCSPGEVLLKELVAHARRQGLRALDFTRGNEPFKSRFCSDVAFNNSYLWARGRWQRAVARIEHSARRAARRMLALARTARDSAGA